MVGRLKIKVPALCDRSKLGKTPKALSVLLPAFLGQAHAGARCPSWTISASSGVDNSRDQAFAITCEPRLRRPIQAEEPFPTFSQRQIFK